MPAAPQTLEISRSHKFEPNQIAAMEEDRLATNLGPAAVDDIESEVTSPAKQPKRRFVGRKAAEKAASNTDANGSIEESSAIQGVKAPLSGYGREIC